MVLMTGDIIVGKNHSQAMGFDAFSSYGLGGGGTVEVNIFQLCQMLTFLSRVHHSVMKFKEVNRKSYCSTVICCHE
jgi:hypothetical protein